MRNTLAFLSLSAVLMGCLGTAHGEAVQKELAAGVPAESLISKIEARFDDPSFAHAHWGVLVESLDTGEVWYARNAERMFIPASNMKILTTAAALEELGPDFTFETRLGHSGKVRGGTLHGDLVVWGNGDPTMYERFQKDSREVFRSWAALLKERGIRRIKGAVIGDDNAWEDAHFDDEWPVDDLVWWYGAPFGPLQFNENTIDLSFEVPAESGGRVAIKPNIESSYFTIINNVRVVNEGAAGLRLRREFGSNILEFSGSLAAGSKAFERAPAISDPTSFYVTALTEVLEEEGIEVTGEPTDVDDLPGWVKKPPKIRPLAVHRSPPLSQILTGLMKRSQNLYAETMVRTMGWQRKGLGTFAAGREVVRERLAAFGIEPESYRFSDGSGLSRYNYISPRQTLAILRGMRASANWELWYDTFPIAGVDGSLRRRMKKTAAEGNARGKTGTLSNVRGLSGYVTTADGELLAYSFLVNGHLHSSSATNAITDDVVALLAGYTSESK